MSAITSFATFATQAAGPGGCCARGKRCLALAAVLLNAGLALAQQQVYQADTIKTYPPAPPTPPAPRVLQPDDKSGAKPVTERENQPKRPVQPPVQPHLVPAINADVKKVQPPAVVNESKTDRNVKTETSADKQEPSKPPIPPVLVKPKSTDVPGDTPIPVPEQPRPTTRLANTPNTQFTPLQPPATSRSLPATAAASPGPVRRLLDNIPFEPGQLLILWPGKEAATAGINILRQSYQLVPRQRHELENLGLTLVLLVFPSDQQARLWRDRLRREHPDWVIDLNARAGLLQSSTLTSLTAAPRLYAQKMLTGQTGQLIGLPPAQPNPAHELRLGVIDTGLASGLMQPGALNGSTVLLRSMIEPAQKPADPAHGSAVLQLMAGAARQNSFAGVGPPARLFWAASLRDVAGKPVTNSLVLALALDWLVGQRVVMVNMSLGGQGDAVLQAVVRRVLGLNVTLVAAAGNSPALPARPSYPAAYSGVWATTAVDAAGRLYSGATRASYTLLAAPGAELWVPSVSASSNNNSSNSGSYVSGTSYASALASATLAWLPREFWSLDAAQRSKRVCAQSIRLPDNQFLGCGLVQKFVEKPRIEAAR